MKLGILLRNSGPTSTPEVVRGCARAADDAGLDSLWVNDHIAIPPDDADGSGGRYLDPLATLAFAAGATRRIGLGVGVLVLPYRPPLPTAKWIATIQELSEGRLLLGVGVGWMEPEFRALGIDRQRRGRDTDELLDFLATCFAEDRVERNGQPFLFLPRPARPPIFVGGGPAHAFRRIVTWGDGWMPMGADVGKLAPKIAQLRDMCHEASRPTPEAITFAALPIADPAAAREKLHELAEAGITPVVHGHRADDVEAFQRIAGALAELAG